MTQEIEIFGHRAEQLKDGDVFRVQIISREGRRVAVLDKVDPEWLKVFEWRA